MAKQSKRTGKQKKSLKKASSTLSRSKTHNRVKRKKLLRTSSKKKKTAKPASKTQKNIIQRDTSHYHVKLKPREEFVLFRIDNSSKHNGPTRVLGKTRSGKWETQQWLIDKNDAHIEDDMLVGDSEKAKNVLDKIPGKKVRVEGDVIETRRR